VTTNGNTQRASNQERAFTRPKHEVSRALGKVLQKGKKKAQKKSKKGSIKEKGQ
jgi:hypothetical protein